jgi:hypothetical protein
MPSADDAPAGCPFQRASNLAAEIIRRNYQPTRPDGRRPRGVHDKTHACLRAEFHVLPPADPRLQHGLFAAETRHPALIRFSSSTFQTDWQPDLRGLAIKLHGVCGDCFEDGPAGQQDFVLMNEPTALFRDDQDVLEILRVLDGRGLVGIADGFIPRMIFSRLHRAGIRWPHVLGMFKMARQRFRTNDLLRFDYHSISPYRLGDLAVKYRLRPDDAVRARQRARGPTFTARLQSTLDQGPVAFTFCIQPRLGDHESLETVSRAWRGPAFPVARLTVPPQDVAATRGLGDKLTFNPWHGLRAHAPLGRINAMRRTAYRVSAEYRGAQAEFPHPSPPA